MSNRRQHHTSRRGGHKGRGMSGCVSALALTLIGPQRAKAQECIGEPTCVTFMLRLMATKIAFTSNSRSYEPFKSGTVQVSKSVVAWTGSWSGHASNSEPPIHALVELDPNA